ncbi:hypothetical protein BDR26DRAFT_858929 [Obelidium mucronatum]|nr:hypothetical protein BDR26DRAFT_858929 [Obelidium mucronatum]
MPRKVTGLSFLGRANSKFLSITLPFCDPMGASGAVLILWGDQKFWKSRLCLQETNHTMSFILTILFFLFVCLYIGVCWKEKK